LIEEQRETRIAIVANTRASEALIIESQRIRPSLRSRLSAAARRGYGRTSVRRLLALIVLFGLASVACTQKMVHFPSLDGAPATLLDGYLFKAEETARHPAVVFLHGCGGLLNRAGSIVPRERDWAARFNAAGMTVLMVDSFHHFDWPNMPVHQVPAFKTRTGAVPIEGTDVSARADALQRVLNFFGSALLAPVP
jgi:poly(3-hydroxybutyrate) depolymerase